MGRRDDLFGLPYEELTKLGVDPSMARDIATSSKARTDGIGEASEGVGEVVTHTLVHFGEAAIPAVTACHPVVGVALEGLLYGVSAITGHKLGEAAGDLLEKVFGDE